MDNSLGIPVMEIGCSSSKHISVIQQGSNGCTKVLFLKRTCCNAFFCVPCRIHTMFSLFLCGTHHVLCKMWSHYYNEARMLSLCAHLDICFTCVNTQ